MSIFNQPTGNAPVENQNQNDNAGADIDYVKELEKKGYKIDVNELAKKAYHADQHITNLETEQAGLRSELEKRLSYEKLMEKIESTSAKAPTNNPSSQGSDQRTGSEADQGNKGNLSNEEIVRIAQETFNKELSRRNQETNRESCRAELTKAWGNDYTKKLMAKANELGAQPDFLDHMASTNPKAFLTLMGVTSSGAQPSAPQVSAPNSNVRSSPVSMGGNSAKEKRDYYRRMMVENPSQYWKPATQREMHKLAMELGEDFTN